MMMQRAHAFLLAKLTRSAPANVAHDAPGSTWLTIAEPGRIRIGERQHELAAPHGAAVAERHGGQRLGLCRSPGGHEAQDREVATWVGGMDIGVRRTIARQPHEDL